MTPDEQWIAKYREAVSRDSPPAKSSIETVRAVVGRWRELMMHLVTQLSACIQRVDVSSDSSAISPGAPADPKKMPHRAEYVRTPVYQHAAPAHPSYEKRAG
jgi:hypothetical protein